MPSLTELRLMKTAVVTGGSSGIGLSCCRKFLENGYRVYELSRREPKIQTVGVKHISCDVTDERSVSEAFKKIYNDSGSIDILVNNAGFGISGAVEFTELAEAKKQFDVNFFGCFICSKNVIKYMRLQGGGRIVNLSSLAAPLAIPFQAFYSASKAAVNSLTLALANEVRPFNIKVCAVMPGDVKTGFTAAREKNTAGDEFYGETLKRAVAGMERDEQNGMSPDDIADAVYAAATKARPKLLSTKGAKYHLFLALSKALPVSLVNIIVGKLYS